jgi:hypothetical protein
LQDVLWRLRFLNRGSLEANWELRCCCCCLQADRERLKAERAAAEALLAKEAGADDALYGDMDEPAPAPAPAPTPAPAPAPAPASAPAPAPAPEPAPAKAADAVEKSESAPKATTPSPTPAATAAPTPAAIPEGVPPSTTENIGIVGSKDSGGKTFYDIRWTDPAGTVVRFASGSLQWPHPRFQWLTALL